MYNTVIPCFHFFLRPDSGNSQASPLREDLDIAPVLQERKRDLDEVSADAPSPPTPGPRFAVLWLFQVAQKREDEGFLIKLKTTTTPVDHQKGKSSIRSRF